MKRWISLEEFKVKNLILPIFYGILSATLLCTESNAYGLGLGIVLGGPTGISLKSNPRGRSAIDGALALSNNKLTLQSQYIKHHSKLVYYGIGARLKLNLEQNEKEYTSSYSTLSAKGDKDQEDEDSLGLGDLYARAPLGVRVFVEEIEIFGEGALLMKLVPSTSFSIEVALGARVYF